MNPKQREAIPRLWRNIQGFCLLIGFILAAGLVCWVFFADQSRALSYQGKSLEYWFHALPLTSTSVGAVRTERVTMFSQVKIQHPPSGTVREYGCWVEDFEASKRAIQAIGSNAIPLYIGKLSQRDRTGFPGEIRKAALRLGLVSFQDANVERQQAVTALILLKPLPARVVREVAVLSTNSNSEISGAARCVLATQPSRLPPTFRNRYPNLELDLVETPASEVQSR
jgi:hypothetical protein